MAKIKDMKSDYERQGFHLQRLYKRRKTDDAGNISSNWSCLREVSALDN